MIPTLAAMIFIVLSAGEITVTSNVSSDVIRNTVAFMCAKLDLMAAHPLMFLFIIRCFCMRGTFLS